MGVGQGGVRFSLNPTSISASYYQNDPAPMMQSVATATGTLPEQLFIGAVDEGTAIDPQISVFLSGQQATFQITPRSGLAPGVHTGRLRLMACTTQSCGNQIGNSPLFLPYTITVRQDLAVSPSQDNYTGQSGSEISVPLTVTFPEGATTFQARAHEPERRLQRRGCHRQLPASRAAFAAVGQLLLHASGHCRHTRRAAHAPIHVYAAARRRSRHFRNS